VLSKLLITLPVAPFFHVPPALLAFATEYNSLVLGFLILFKSLLTTFFDFLTTFRSEYLYEGKLLNKVSSLENLLEAQKQRADAAEEAFLKKESDLKAVISDLRSSLDLQQEKNNRLLAFNEVLHNNSLKNSTLPNNSWFSLPFLSECFFRLLSLYAPVCKLYGIYTGEMTMQAVMAELDILKGHVYGAQQAHLEKVVEARQNGVVSTITNGLVIPAEKFEFGKGNPSNAAPN
jgi:hypothetical protein